MNEENTLPPWAAMQKKVCIYLLIFTTLNYSFFQTFTKWLTTMLEHKGINIDDLTTDFSDGLKLIALVEQISNCNVTRNYTQEIPKQCSHFPIFEFCTSLLDCNCVQRCNWSSALLKQIVLRGILVLVLKVTFLYEFIYFFYIFLFWKMQIL